jgi:glycosyltransferase involved in cell wall biosynthesis
LRPARVSDMTHGEIGWYWDNETWTGGSIDPGVVQRTTEWGATDVVIQYHAAFFSGERLVELARSFMRAGVAVTVVIHNLEGVDRSALRTLRREGCLLLSHSRREVTQARGEGVDLVRMPLLVPVVSLGPARSIRDRDLTERPPLIATVGFIRPHKGIVPLIESMPAVRARFPGARLLLQCALYPSADSRQELESCRKAIERLGLEGAIELDTEFRPIEYVHDRLASADLGVLPYGPSNEGGSASAATLLAAGLPVLLSDSPVFADALDAADVLTDVRPSTIATAIVSAFETPQRYEVLAHRAHRYVRLNSAPAIAARLLELLEQRRDERSLSEAA